MKPKVHIVPKWAMPFGYGLCLYNHIFIRKDGNFVPLLKHETTHSRQWQKIGLFKFPFLYLLELMRNGYHQNKYEIEAKMAERR